MIFLMIYFQKITLFLTKSISWSASCESAQFSGRILLISPLKFKVGFVAQVNCCVIYHHQFVFPKLRIKTCYRHKNDLSLNGLVLLNFEVCQKFKAFPR